MTQIVTSYCLSSSSDGQNGNLPLCVWWAHDICNVFVHEYSLMGDEGSKESSRKIAYQPTHMINHGLMPARIQIISLIPHNYRCNRRNFNIISEQSRFKSYQAQI